MKICSLFFPFTLLCIHLGANGLLDDPQQILTNFKARYNNSKSDLIFLLDVSGSVSYYGFDSEKIFVENLLNEFSVAPYSTRVAVITFGYTTQTDINYIDIDPQSKVKQKCDFKPWLKHNVQHRRGPATNMKEAIERAGNVLKDAINHGTKRENVHTVAFMITDGFWNMGDPRSSAGSFKSTYNVDLFMVGVQGYRQWQLEALASTPEHVLEFSSFTKFKELAMYTRGDAHDKTFMEVYPNNCTSTNGCDQLAFCGCGTVSGVYQCVCQAGYYGTGIADHCKKCPVASYKKFPSPTDCTACPDHSTTKGEGTIELSDCFCKTGYEGDPSSGITCRAVECEVLLAPENGRFLASCGHVYNDVCKFDCNSGYTLSGSSLRRCQSNKEWSGIHPTCNIITCSPLPALAYGNKTCTGQGSEYGDHCTFTCDVGYERKGSSDRVCQADSQWSGEQTQCEARQCPALRQLAFGTIDPPVCTTAPQSYKDVCIMTCLIGYVMTGDSKLTCGADGTWQGVYPICQDIQPPEITCPSDVFGGTDPERPIRTVSWSTPVAQDNAELNDANAAPVVTQSPANIVSPYDFPIGTTRITFTATDKSNNSQSCVFTVTIEDNEAPTLFCPANIEVDKESSVQSVAVFWPPPTYWDNSGNAVTLFTSSVNGSQYTKGQSFVKYEATDNVGNKAQCTFIILVSAVRCKSYPPPINGSLACHPFGSDDLCAPFCNEKKEFSRTPAALYSCTSAGIWEIWDLRPEVLQIMPWPDCTEEYVPGAARRGMTWQYFTGDCNDPAVQNQTRLKFIEGFNNEFKGDCLAENLCSFENIVIKCGATKRRKKRSQPTLTIALDVSVFTTNSTYGQAKTTLETTVLSAEASLASLNVPGSQYMTLYAVSSTPTYAVCIEGSVFELNKDINHQEKCQNCPAGTFFDRAINNCTNCPLDTYNTYTGQLQCFSCPTDTYTFAMGTKNRTDCLAACQPGSISPTGLANCEACAINYYQPLERQTSCHPCPGSSVTLAQGAKSIAECGMPCAPGTYSQTGVEPCLPCAKGTYQPNTNQKSCVFCSGGLSTYGVGASSSSQCVDIDDCASSPCNNGQCANTITGFQCICDAGYTGTKCEIEEEECTSNPCAQGATCVDKVNGFLCLCPPEYTGDHCDVKTSTCSDTKCASGSTCVNSPEGHDCICPEGYTGKFCETKINDCDSGPCNNGGNCFNENNSFRCECPSGFSGNLCEKSDNGCLPDSCLNGATCTETSYGHKCDCAAGFAGLRCEVDVNECSSAPCQNNGQCVDQVNGYSCYCKPSYHGSNCETEVSTDFDFEFDRSKGRGTSIVTMRQELRAFTVAFWMKVDDDQLDPGTPVSYAVQVGETVQDNALVIHDYNGFNIWVNGQKASTNVAANDNKWHHIAATWQSATGGWKVYKDGSNVRHNDAATEPFQKGQVIAAGGKFVLGQEQDEVGSNFTASEAFIGKMSQLNIWSYELDAQDIKTMGRHAKNIIGNVIAWSDFYQNKDDGITEIKPSAARTENECWGEWVNNDLPTDGDGDTETRPADCPSPKSFDCQDVEGRSLNDLEVNISSTCSESGIVCLNSDQGTGRSCPDFKVRYVCSCPVNSACNSNPCGQHGTCEHLPVGYKCNCNAGYEGRNCETANTCPCPGKIANGRYTGNRNISDTITVSCDAGFEVSGTATVTCTGTGWDAPVAQCVDVDECTQGQASCSQTCVNTMGSYICKCNAGYSLQADGSCTDINECDTNNGNCQSSCHNFVGSYRCSCPSGYTLLADGRSCQDDDECSSNSGLGPCEQICINTLASYVCLCNPGYTLNADGLTCQANSCPTLPSLPGGSLTPANPSLTLDSKVRFECSEGYALKGPSSRTCVADGSWSGADSSCQAVQCILPGTMQDGQQDVTANSYQTVVTYSCNNGFLLVGSATRTCQADGTWSGEFPRCIAADCPDPTVPTNGKVLGLQRTIGDTILFECDIGYYLVGASYAICSQGGSWSSPSPTCPEVSCGPPPAIPDGTIHGSDYTYNATVTFSCNAANFKLSGSAERTCQLDGTWSGTQTVCLENSCGDPGTPENAQRIGDNYKYHDVVTFQCILGYQLVGSSSRTCQTDGFWTGTQPTCEVISCGDPGTPVNGERHGSDFSYARTITYDCDPGYQLSGSRARSCQLDGQWSGSVATCTASSCGASLVGPSGDFTSPGYPNVYSNNAYCRWKISVPSGMKVMLTFNSFKTQKNNDVVEIYDGVSLQQITILSGVYSEAMSFTSQNNAIDIRFVTDGSQTSEGFSASYKQVSCGGIINYLDEVITSPNYPSNYPDSVTCVWAINIGVAFQLELDEFYTEAGYDLLTGYSSLSSFTQNDLVFEIDGQRINMEPIQVTTGKMLLRFKSNSVRNFVGFQISVKQYTIIVGK